MLAWFESLPLLEQIFFYIALPATLILIIQTIMLFFGSLGSGQGDMDLDSDTSAFDSADGADFSFEDSTELIESDLDDVTDPDATNDGSLDSYGLRFFTIRGVIAFLTVAGWTGICCMEIGGGPFVSVFLSIIFGAASMVGIAYLVRAMLRLQVNTNINYRSALGQVGDVYLTIPASGGGVGKVSLSLGGAYSQYEAVTHEAETIKTGELVRITDIIRDNVMVVERESRD